MPVFHLTTPNSDSDTSSTNPEEMLLPSADIIPRSSRVLASVTEHPDRTDKWLETVVKYTLENEKKNEPDVELKYSVEKKNTIDVKRHRVYSTRLDVQPKRQPSSPNVEEKPKGQRRDLSGSGELSSWIASEIFNIAKTQATEVKNLHKKMKKDLEKDKEDVSNVEKDILGIEYDEVESIIGEYFDDINVTESAVH